MKAHGAVYEGDLTKSITHLISFRTEGAKYNAARNWRLHIVSLEWLRDSLERGMILDEKLYDPALPPDQRGLEAWNKTMPPRTALGKRPRDDGTASDGSKRKLRRTASAKLSTQNEQMWGDIVGSATASSTVAQVNRSGVWETNDDHTANAPSSVSRQNAEETAQAGPTQVTVAHEPTIDGIFTGCRFLLVNYDDVRKDVLRQHLISNGAEIVDSDRDLLNVAPNASHKRPFRMVPHDMTLSEIPKLESQLPVDTVTYLWLERCLHQKRFLEPSEHVLGRPFPKLKIEGFESVSISSSAFTGIDLIQFARAVKMIGAEYREVFTADTSILVTKSLRGVRMDKYEFAQQWKTPIVKVEWIWDCISAGQKLSYSSPQYLCRHRTRTESLPDCRQGGVSKAPTNHSRTSSDTRALSKTSAHSSKSSMRPPRKSGLDNSAFASDGPSAAPARSSRKLPRESGPDNTAFEPGTKTPAGESSRQVLPSPSSTPDYHKAVRQETAEDLPVPQEPEPEEPSIPSESTLKQEPETQGLPSLPAAPTEDSQDLAYKSNPLSEVTNNSPTRSSHSVSTAPAPSDRPAPRRQQEMSNAISNLLAKAKTAPAPDAPEPRKRGRILGRVASNMSAGSTSRSRATSVDSTATHGHPVEYPPHNSNDQTANERIQMLLTGDKPPDGIESQPPATQLQYEDPDSTEARQAVMAKMRGEKVQRRSGVREKAITLGDLGDVGRPTRRAAAGRGLR